MHEIRTEIEIAAAPEKVWSLLINFAGYPEWNPFIRSIEGVAAKDEKLTVSIQPPGSKAMKFHPTVLAVTPGRELRWLGHFISPGIFDGEHYLQIVPVNERRVMFVQGEIFSGLLVGILKSFLDGKTKEGFIMMNKALKSLAESDVG